MLIGYVRVSKSDGSQSVAPQRDALLAAGVEPERIYEDLASGRHDARPGLTACLKALQPGNTLVIWKLDRLGRNLRDLLAKANEEKSGDQLAGLAATSAAERVAAKIALADVRLSDLVAEPLVDDDVTELVQGRLDREAFAEIA